MSLALWCWIEFGATYSSGNDNFEPCRLESSAVTANIWVPYSEHTHPLTLPPLPSLPPSLPCSLPCPPFFLYFSLSLSLSLSLSRSPSLSLSLSLSLFLSSVTMCICSSNSVESWGLKPAGKCAPTFPASKHLKTRNPKRSLGPVSKPCSCVFATVALG